MSIRHANPDDICPIHNGPIKNCPGHSTATLTVMDAKTKQPKVVRNSATCCEIAHGVAATTHVVSLTAAACRCLIG